MSGISDVAGRGAANMVKNGIEAVAADGVTGMTVGIAGLGLIGGSLAKAIRERAGCRVLGCDIRGEVVEAAISEGVIAGGLNEENISECSLVIAALYPGDVISYCKENIPFMKEGAVVVDCAGVKTRICEELPAFAKSHGVRFVGGHPMAGIESSGYGSSFAGLFDGATMILCKDGAEERELNELGTFFKSIGFGSLKITTAKEHDEVIAYTSQLAHIASSAYIRSDTMKRRYGFSAGSFKDLTRVAKLDEEMWALLFFENRENLLNECDKLLGNIRLYRDALASLDGAAMKELLRSGAELKIEDENNEIEWLRRTLL